MSNDAQTPSEFDRREPIPGYTVVELLGRGGYGEVWRATAPGGLAKAVKIVYGDGEASPAVTEMRSLARVKDVRHPLLLSIERIEVIQGNLVIVTELADGSLKQRFLQCRESGATGIPQDELFGYLTDVADALDFLYARYSLQHLDVKPENILLVGGRAKVGDFGLVKNLYERGASLIGGLTPTYAPPEMFEGRPTHFTDQYSLAVVYMQMLTGALPFQAGSVAQLAAQHLRGVPDLSALPKRQSTVIARALSKDPAQRFETCQAFVAALKESVNALSHPLPTSTLSDSATDTVQPVTPPTVARPMPAIAPDDTADIERPLVLVAVGGTGVEVLAKLVERLRDRFGSVESWPPIELVALDTNVKELTSRFGNDVLDRVHLVPMPLKAPEYYGSNAGKFLGWLNRRWLYNVPRDLKTSGYRPLGRLALLTNAGRVHEALSLAVRRVMESTGVDAPRAVLLGAISGGTGSGAILDLAYALRSELKRQGLSDEHVYGLLLHAEPRANADRDKARANAYATLNELSHFSQAGGHYPGEPALGAVPFHGDNATFTQTHLLDCGSGLGQAEWELATQQVAEFVYGTNFTTGRRVLKPVSAVNQSNSHHNRPLTIRRYDVLTLSAGSGAVISHAVRRACADVVRLWREGRRCGAEHADDLRSRSTAMMNVFTSTVTMGTAEVETAISAKLAECHLRFEDLAREAANVVELETGGDPSRRLADYVDQALSATADARERPTRVDKIVEMLDRVIRRQAEVHLDERSPDSMYEQIIARLSVRSREHVAGFLAWLRGLVDAPDVRVEGARQHALVATKHWQHIQEKAAVQAAELDEAALAISLDARGTENTPPERSRFRLWNRRRENPGDQFREAILAYAETRLQEVQLRAVVKLARVVDAQLTTLVEQLDRVSRELNSLGEPARTQQTETADNEDSRIPGATVLAQYRQLLLSQLTARRHPLAQQIEESIDRELFAGQHGLQRFLDPNAEVRQCLSRPLAQTARRAVLDALHEIGGQLVLASANGLCEEGTLDLKELVAQGFSACAVGEDAEEVTGKFLIVPDSCTGLEAALPDVIVCPGHKAEITLLSVRREMPAGRVADALIGGVEIYKELASRLHTRTDIAWSSFSSQTAPELPSWNITSEPSPTPSPSTDVAKTVALAPR